MRRLIALLGALAVVGSEPCWLHADDAGSPTLIKVDELEDKIRGGMLAQVIGNLNGLPHEFKYIDEPGAVVDYTPSLPEGAWTDDDTDIEWVYLREIARSGQSRLAPPQITELWKRHINRRIFCANNYARHLMDLGLEPPWTGNSALNPWSDFNISGQFLCESFGLMAPAMPQTAAQLGLSYTRTAIDGEPAQTTQLFATMIATAFVETDTDKIIDAGLKAVDPNCNVAKVVRQVRDICREHPDDWQMARGEIKRRWQTHGGAMRDRNGYELNTACTIAALIYGRQDFVDTLRLAFNLGWDCDNNAATAATIVGVIKGRRWMDAQRWDIADKYRNTTRDDMPMDETLTSLEDTVVKCARLVIAEQGGELTTDGGERVYRIAREEPANVAPLSTTEQQEAQVRETILPQLSGDLAGSPQARARAAYVAICMGEAARLKLESPAEWTTAIESLQKYPDVVRDLYTARMPAAEKLQERARQAGLAPPQ